MINHIQWYPDNRTADNQISQFQDFLSGRLLSGQCLDTRLFRQVVNADTNHRYLQIGRNAPISGRFGRLSEHFDLQVSMILTAFVTGRKGRFCRLSIPRYPGKFFCLSSWYHSKGQKRAFCNIFFKFQIKKTILTFMFTPCCQK